MNPVPVSVPVPAPVPDTPCDAVTIARPPDRRRTVHTPVALEVHEWGPADGPVLALIHGGGDFARSFDGFAPLLADAGWRVVAWDQRGHGDSDRAALYSWNAELRDAEAVLRSCGGGPLRVVGHSKGGVLTIELAAALPELIRAIAVIDGFARRVTYPEPVAAATTGWLDARRRLRPFRSGTVEELATRRAASSPLVPAAWLRYLVEVGTVTSGAVADTGEADTFAWKLDAAAFPYPPHPSPMATSLALLPHVPCPMLGLRAGVDEAIGGQPSIETLRDVLPATARLEVLDGLGHFAHVEDPRRVAALVLDFLGRPSSP